MIVIVEINRGFPFQVPLSFDEAAMNVLDWLEECSFEWDMYVDLPANTVRYCFRTLEDAAAFRRQFTFLFLSSICSLLMPLSLTIASGQSADFAKACP
jgi:hypothetical protein